MNEGPSLVPKSVEEGDLPPERRPTYLERRQSERIPVRIAIDVYNRSRYLGRYWTRDASREGLFLEVDNAERLKDTILSLRFKVEGVERRLQGIAVRAVQGKGVGVQLAVWRLADRTARALFRRLIEAEHSAAGATKVPSPLSS